MHVTADLSSFHILARLAMAELPSPSRVRAMDLLPDDLLADVLARLPPCSLAASRCVRKHWCAIIDTRRLLRADLLPLRLDGFFCVLETPRNYDDDTFCLFFSRPSTACRINADLYILDHCNGLLLIWGVNPYVINPATRQRVPLPPFPEITRQRVHFKSFFSLHTIPWRHRTMRLFLSLFPEQELITSNSRSHRSGHHHRSRCRSSHRGNGGGRRGPLFGKERLPRPLPTCSTTGSKPSICGEHFMCIDRMTLL